MQSQTVNSYIFEPTMITIMRNGLNDCKSSKIIDIAAG